MVAVVLGGDLLAALRGDRDPSGGLVAAAPGFLKAALMNVHGDGGVGGGVGRQQLPDGDEGPLERVDPLDGDEGLHELRVLLEALGQFVPADGRDNRRCS